MVVDVMRVRLHLRLVRVIEVETDTPSVLAVRVSSTRSWSRCPDCGFVCRDVHDRRAKPVRDLAVSGRPTTLVWDRRRFACGNCGQRHLESHPEFEGGLTRRLARDLVRDAKVMSIRAVARRLAAADSVSVYEDLGIEMAPNSTLVSWLQRVLWVLVGSFAKPGAMTAHTSVAPLFSYGASGAEPTDPVTGGAIISGLVPCNEIAEGMLSDHPERTRALFIESANPVHSLAESESFRKAMRAAELTVVVDVAMTETARLADYVLPAASQFEKPEATFFNLEFPHNTFHLRHPLLEPLEGTLAEPEIYSRLLEQLGVLDPELLAPLRAAAADSSSSCSPITTRAGVWIESPRSPSDQSAWARRSPRVARGSVLTHTPKAF